MFHKSGPAVALGTAVLIAADLLVAPAWPARANGTCTNADPPLYNVPIKCYAGTSESIPILLPVQVIQLSVIGGGGGGSSATPTQTADGGDGARITGWARLPMGTTALQVTAGLGGATRTPVPGVLTGAEGGQASGVYALRDGGLPPVPLIIAGGGGGAGGTERSGATSLGSGGNAGRPVTTLNPAPTPAGAGESAGDIADALAEGGVGGGDNQPGHGGANPQTSGYLGQAAPGMQGSAPVPSHAYPAGGGAGAAPGGGGGGGGYYGGGGGGGQRYALPPVVVAGGGGGGSSYLSPLTFDTDWGQLSPLGRGGQGLAVPSDGGPGQVRIDMLLPPKITSISPAGGPLGGEDVITITGQALAGTTANQQEPDITVGGTPCVSVDYLSPTEVKCKVPPNLVGAQDVKLTGLHGEVTEVGGYTYAGLPDIGSLDPVQGSVGGGTTLTVTGTDLETTSSIKINGVTCPGAGAQQAYVATPTSVTCTVPASADGTGLRDVEVTTLGGTDTQPLAFRYTGPPVIASVLPTAGPQAGGNSMTILGEDMGGVAMVVVGDGQCASVSPTTSTVTCVVPSATAPGKVQVVVSSSAGVDVKPSAYEYRPAPITVPNRPPVITNPEPTTAPTTTAPTTAPTLPPPPAAPKLSLALDIAAGAPVSGAGAKVSGGGLRGNSQYTVTMYSSPVRLASGYADETGSFTAQFKVPQRACVKGGLHRVVLSGFAPDGTVVSTTNWVLFDDSCTTRALPSPARPAVVTYGTFRFDYASAKLTPYVKAVLKRTRSTLTSAKRVTITGYTQTTSRGEGAKPANRALGLRRAKAIRAYLRELGLKAPVTVIGAGAVDPLKGRPQRFNRRVYVTARY